VAENGRRILPEGWVDYSAELTPQSGDEYGYGAGIWTQRGNSGAAGERIVAGMPADSFTAIGSQGQYTIVIPSQDLVIVKIGWAYTPNDGRVAAERLVKETIAGLQLLANSPQERRKRSPDEHSDNRGIVRQRPRISLGFIRAKA
jgi:CubicO group peptidase (beta-lactamase class C family)